MSILSIMVDEAGNFDMNPASDRLYCITLVFHNQDDDISPAIAGFEAAQRAIGFDPSNAVHTNPLIRKKPPYEDLDKATRKSLFSVTATFIQRLPIRCKSFLFNKGESKSISALIAKMIRQINTFIYDNLEFFQQFDGIRLYYDKGQKEVSHVLNSTFSAIFPNLEMRLARQKDFKLLQVADFICTLECTNAKWDAGNPTTSALAFFVNRRAFIRNYYNNIRKFKL